VSEQETRSYEELLEERNRLWEELQRRNAMEEDLAYWRGRAADIERSRWWRAGEPLRELKRLAAKASASLRRRDW
jgi:hypothetical protein